jgi:enoyl-CoA hydratase/carnithine racemase
VLGEHASARPRIAGVAKQTTRSGPHVRYEPADAAGVARLVFSRADKLNATDDAFLFDFDAALVDARADAAARAIVVAGDGRAFCVGIDLRALVSGGIPEDWFARWDGALAALEALPAPAVAAIRGPCLGGGLQAALCCDLRVASEDATFGLSAVTHGIVPGLATLRLERFVGAGAARELMLLGETWNAARASRHGLVDRVVPNEELDEHARAVAMRLASSPREAMRATKRLTLAAHELSLGDFMKAYVEAQQRCRGDAETRSNLERYARARWGDA